MTVNVGKMRIGYLIPGCSVSGGVAVICQHANRLIRRGHSVVLLSIADADPIDWFPDQQAPVRRASEWSEDLDVIVATEWSTAFWLPRIEAKAKCYFVQSDETRFHPDNSRWQHLATLTYYFGVNYLTEARWIRKWLKDNFGHEAALVPNGVDTDIFRAGVPLAPKTGKPRVLLEGAIGLPYKGMREAFEAVSNINAEIWCVSSFGTPESSWRCDRFFERVPMQDMHRIYTSCDILLKLSRVEGFFGPPMEMMACGGSVVVGRVTGHDEYIVDGRNALVVDPLDVRGAEAAVQRLINDLPLRTRLVEAGAQTVREWGWEPSIDILESYYSQLLAGPTCWDDNLSRQKYDMSLAYVYGKLSAGILPEDIVSARPHEVIPPHVQRLASYMASSVAFRWLADAVRFGLGLFRWLRRSS